MREQLWQVCKVYLTSISWSTAFVLFFLACMQLLAIASSDQRNVEILFTVLPGVVAAQTMAQLVRHQFANYRARLTPGFSGPHLAVLGGGILVLVVLNPLLVSYIRGIPPLFAVGLSLALLAIMLLSTLWPTFGFVLAVPIMAIVSSFDSTREFWNSLISHSLAHITMLLMAILGIAAWCWRLTILTEEMPDYETLPVTNERQDRAKIRATQGTGKTGLARWVSDRWHDRLPMPGTTVLQRFSLFHYGFNSLPFSVSALLVSVAATIYTIWLSSDADHEVSPALPVILWLVLLLPVAAVCLLSTRVEWMSQEGLLPVTRRERVGQLFSVSAKNSFLLWLIGVWTVVVIALRSTSDENESLASVVFAFACLSAVVQVPVFGIGLLLALSRELLARIIGLVLLAFGCLAVFLIWWDGWILAPNWGAVLGIAMFVIPLGIFLISHAHKLWLDAELG